MRPMNMRIMMMILPVAVSDEVIPVDRPTVAIALTASKISASRSVRGSEIVRNRIAVNVIATYRVRMT